MGAKTDETVQLMNHRLDQLRAFEGRRVCLTLVGDSRIDDCEVVSAAYGPVENVWVYSNGIDRFVPLTEVVDFWEVPPSGVGPPEHAL